MEEMNPDYERYYDGYGVPYQHYSKRYFNLISKIYPPEERNLKAQNTKINSAYRKELIEAVGIDGYVLMEWFVERVTYRYFNPQDNKHIGDSLGLSPKKIERIKKKLKEHNYLLIVKVNSNPDVYQTIMGKSAIKAYLGDKFKPNEPPQDTIQ